ncbi:MAG TPA: nitroreductase family protein [Chloroflexota bacterium]|jgi:nitroreductase|nr:nitroreductase family protein [Chloroflexota bacterium]
MDERLSMPLGEAIYSQRAIRRLKPDPIPDHDLASILRAAGRAPSGSNGQPWRFLVIRDPARKKQLAECYREAWWARRHAIGIHKPEDIPATDKVGQAALRFTTEFENAPVLVLICSTSRMPNEVLTGVQNLMLAARALGVGSTITAIGGPADAKVHELFGIPADVEATFVIPLGYPRGQFGPAARKPLKEIAFLDTYGRPGPWD